MKTKKKKAPVSDFSLSNETEKPDTAPRPIVKQRATPSAVRTLANLQKLADGAEGGERDSALAAVERLRAKWDFDNPIEEITTDIFAGVIPASVGGYASEIMEFAPGESLVASFTKWAIENGFNLRARFRRTSNGGEAIAVEAEAAHVPRLKALATTIRDSFGALWLEFRRVAISDERDATTFFRGLYDGMMRDERRAGELLPTRHRQPGAVRKAKAKTLAARGVALHPYSVGFDMGGKIRLAMPTEDIAAEIHRLAESAA